jgi:hypothetical protein
MATHCCPNFPHDKHCAIVILSRLIPVSIGLPLIMESFPRIGGGYQVLFDNAATQLFVGCCSAWQLTRLYASGPQEHEFQGEFQKMDSNLISGSR